MKKVAEYIEEIKTITGSDYATAKALGITKQSISAIRKGGNIKDETAVKMADILGVDREELVMAATIARSEGEVKKTWEKISRQIGMAAGIVLAIQTVTPIRDNLTFGLCILC